MLRRALGVSGVALALGCAADADRDIAPFVVEGSASRDYARVGTPRCSPGGSHVAAAVRHDGKVFQWIDGHEVGPFDAVSSPRFVAEDLIGLVVRNGEEAAWQVVRAPARWVTRTRLQAQPPSVSR